jgi:hypothetical protein
MRLLSTGVSGAIMNGCAGETEVSITITFYDSYNNEIDIQFVTKLVKPAPTVGFWGGPTGKVTPPYMLPLAGSPASPRAIYPESFIPYICVIFAYHQNPG